MSDAAPTIAIVSMILAVLQTLFVIVQTIRLRNVKKIRDTHIKNILRETSDLAGHLFNEAHGNTHMIQCGEKAQQIQKSLWLLIVNMFDLSKKDVDKLKHSGEIGNFEYEILSSITMDMRG